MEIVDADWRNVHCLRSTLVFWLLLSMMYPTWKHPTLQSSLYDCHHANPTHTRWLLINKHSIVQTIHSDPRRIALKFGPQIVIAATQNGFGLVQIHLDHGRIIQQIHRRRPHFQVIRRLLPPLARHIVRSPFATLHVLRFIIPYPSLHPFIHSHIPRLLPSPSPSPSTTKTKTETSTMAPDAGSDGASAPRRTTTPHSTLIPAQ